MTSPEEVAPVTGFVLSDKWYGLAKWFVQIVLPAFSTLYFTLGSVFELPGVTQVVGTCAAVATFLGIILGVSSRSYNNSEARFGGTMNVVTTEEGRQVTLDISKDPDKLINADEVTFKVEQMNELPSRFDDDFKPDDI